MLQEKSMRSMKRVLEFPTGSLECSSRNSPECARRKGRTHHQEGVGVKRVASRAFFVFKSKSGGQHQERGIKRAPECSKKKLGAHHQESAENPIEKVRSVAFRARRS